MKKISLLVAGLAITVGANAQYSNFSSDSKFCDNWSIGIEGGIQTNMNKFHTPQGGLFGINLNKDLTPMFGLSIEALAGANNIGNWSVPQRHFHNGTGIDYLSGFVTGRWNLSNTLGGFNGGRRVFEVETNVGVGYGKFFTNKHVAGDPWNAFQFKTGLDFNFYFGKNRDISFNIRPALVWDLSKSGQFDSRNGVAQITAGLTYHCLTSNGTHYFVKSDVSALKEEIAALTALNADLQNQLANRPVIEKEVIVEKVVEKVVEAPGQVKKVTDFVDNTFVINFAFDSSALTAEAKQTLDKVPSGANVSIAGYASPEGNKEYNLKLSDRRADAVKAYLEKRGVKVEKTVGYGADNLESNRIVIVTIK